jgi:hypothetical protein
MKLFKASLLALSAAGLLAGCASNGDGEVSLTADGFMGACDNPTVEGAPYEDVLYVVGDFTDSKWKHKPHRALSYKGDNTYQLVVEEKVGVKKLQFAAEDWSPQFTAVGQGLDVGVEGKLKFGGFAKDTKVSIPQDGTYVWSIAFDEQGNPAKAMIALCE